MTGVELVACTRIRGFAEQGQASPKMPSLQVVARPEPIQRVVDRARERIGRHRS
jgi:hypothetical protein